MEDFKKASLDLEASLTPTLHKVIPHMEFLNEKCEVKETDSDVIKNLKLETISKIDSIWKPNIQMEHKVALFLYPQCKKLATMSIEQKSEIYAFIKEIAPANLPTLSPEIPSSPNSSISEIFRKFCTPETNSMMSIDDDISQYLNDNVSTPDADLLEYWNSRQKNLPHLYKIFLKISCIPASSSASERSFSLAEHIFSYKRTKLDSAKLDDLIVIKSNLLVDKSDLYNLTN